MSRRPGNHHGYDVYEEDGYWYYADNDESIEDNPRPCPKCNQYPTKESHDPCIANLPGVKAACCGHGIRSAYVMFTNGVTLQGEKFYLNSIELGKISETS